MLKGKMPLIGAHMSIAGGLDKAFFRGWKAGCDVIQIFSRNTTQWASRPLQQEALRAFNLAQKKTSIQTLAVHNNYLTNPASPSWEIRRKSFKSLLEEVRRAASLRIPYVVMHPGSHMGEGEKRGIKRMAGALAKLRAGFDEFPVEILIETTAGQGTNLGYRFEHIGEMINMAGGGDWMGVCLDTCHVFAAGYDFRSVLAYGEMTAEFDRFIGLERLKLLHMNDSKKDLGSRIDRHEHLGRGWIGPRAFSFFLNDPRFKHLPFIIETPKGKDERGIDWDVRNLNLMRNFVRNQKI